ncbi:hypothetical protein DFO66_103399 [Brevibacterium sanguinis]|uniref:Uncharacterized protein n=2 Tax=Brevibacterium TaxID=1696 RepID=A0A366IMK5_9MICO|nr:MULTISPECIES: hypothetical protein [Brevibacterium]RBP66449.1 hypothetical protein DFO66_103399 [Brevibacterium sanguinis]RBP73101.1 hypothetical protein DFO65_103399 [Brevibacterium celere]
MIDWLPTIIVGLLGVGATYLGVVLTRRSNRDTNRVQQDQLKLQSRDNLIDDYQEQLARTDAKISALEARVAAQDAKIESQGEQIRKLQVSDWALRRYVYRLIDFIRAHGLEPPEPPEPVSLDAP